VNKYTAKPCPGSGSSSSGSKVKVGVIVALLVVVVALIGFGFYLRRTNENFREKTDEIWEKIKGLIPSRSSEGSSGYSSLGGRGGEPQDLDDDDYNDKLLSPESGYNKTNDVSSHHQGEKDDFI
jgi:hypothetical protein